MGLDINIGVDNTEAVYNVKYFDIKANYLHQHILSRTFCNLMTRQNAVTGEPELDQIGRITNIDISPLYDMNNYWDNEDGLEWFVNSADSEVERNERLLKLESDREKISNNIDNIVGLINDLIRQLTSISNLPGLLSINECDEDTLNISSYFSNFAINRNDDDTDHFGRDLRNLNRFLAYAKATGTKTVYFTYG